jgi:group I intron endonuclease
MNYKDACKFTHEAYGLVYLITNTATGKMYVGQTIQKLVDRLKQHKWHGHQSDPKTAIHRTMKKHGFDKFTFDVLETYQNQTELDAAELEFARALNTFTPNGYNLIAGAGAGAMSEETRLKVVAGLTGRVPTQETRDRISDAKTVWYATVEPKIESLRRMRISESKAKTYVFCNPAGERVEITNMKKFSEDLAFNKAQTCKMALIAVGKKRSCMGWSLWVEPGDKPVKDFRKMSYTFRNPEGESITFRSIKEHFESIGFAPNECATMRKVANGTRKQYRGWSVWTEAEKATL